MSHLQFPDHSEKNRSYVKTREIHLGSVWHIRKGGEGVVKR